MKVIAGVMTATGGGIICTARGNTYFWVPGEPWCERKQYLDNEAEAQGWADFFISEFGTWDYAGYLKDKRELLEQKYGYA